MKQIATEYAEALFALACETGEEQAYMSTLDEIAALLRESPEYMELLTSPAIPLRERLAAIDACLGCECPEHVVSMMKLMCEKGRLRVLPDCVAQYRSLLDLKRAVVTARVTSAVALTEEEKDALACRLGRKCGGTVKLDCTVDASLLGGVIVEMNGQVMDGSLRHRLDEVKEVMNG